MVFLRETRRDYYWADLMANWMDMMQGIGSAERLGLEWEQLLAALLAAMRVSRMAALKVERSATSSGRW